MRYREVKKATFLARPNRFIAYVELDGEMVVCHVKNTGRCRELLIPGAEVWLEKGSTPNRKTAWDLIAVRKGEHLINMDAQAPNRIFAEWVANLIRRCALYAVNTDTESHGWTFAWRRRKASI